MYCLTESTYRWQWFLMLTVLFVSLSVARATAAPPTQPEQQMTVRVLLPLIANAPATSSVPVTPEYPDIPIVPSDTADTATIETGLETSWINVNNDALLEAQTSWINVNSDASGIFENVTARDQIRLDLAQDHATGEGVVVAVLDTGINTRHVMLGDHLFPGYDFIDEDNDPVDTWDNLDTDGDRFVDESMGHGSHVSGIVRIVAPNARIMPVRIFNPDGQGAYDTVADGIRYAVDNGADVINLSGSGDVSTLNLMDAVRYAYENGVLIVASAGYPSIGIPAGMETVLSVGALRRDEDMPMSFAKYDDHPADIYAPGESILSAYAGGPSKYAFWTGNSMAAPFVTGVAALMHEANPDCTAACLQTILQESAHPRRVYGQTFPLLDALDAVMAAANDETLDVRIRYRTGDDDPARAIYPLLRIDNYGRSVHLSDLAIRYWYNTPPGGTQIVECGYALVVCGNLDMTVYGDYLEIGFDEAAGMLMGETESGLIKVRVRYTDWRETYDQTDDHSYTYAPSFVVSENIGIYYRGELVWGNEPVYDFEGGSPFDIPIIEEEPDTGLFDPIPTVQPDE